MSLITKGSIVCRAGPSTILKAMPAIRSGTKTINLARNASTSSTFRPTQIRMAPAPEAITATSFSSMPSDGPQPGKPRIRTLFYGLIALAIAATGAGLYTFYGSFTTWPKEVRDDLRAGLKAQRNGDWAKAEARFRKALETATALPQDKLGDDALLKLSGISISLGSVLEHAGHLRKAYDVYAEALQNVIQQGKTPAERMRAVALSQKCGDLANIREVRDSFGLGSASQSKAEEHLRWSVEELLRLVVPDETRQSIVQGNTGAIYVSDLDLPPWLTDTTLGASLESLGQFYAAQGRSSYAIPLYLQAINVLMPGDKDKRKHNPTVAERCRAGILMNNVAQLLVDSEEANAQPKTEEATQWAMRGLDIVQFALRGTGWDGKGGQGFKSVEGSDDRRMNEVKGQCWTAQVALLINLGELSRLRKDNCKAREFFQRAYQQADTYGMREARSRCAQALSELERTKSSV